MKEFWKLLTTTIVFTLTLAVLLALIVFIAREAFLWQGTRSFKRDLVALNRMSTNKSCESEFGSIMTEGEQMYRQVRFTSSRAYVLELICPGFPDQPLASEQRVLSSFVSKLPGSAGILQRTDVVESYVGLTVFQELAKGLPEQLRPWLGWISTSELIGLAASETVVKPFSESPTETALTQYGQGPVSSCEGYGFICCDGQTQYGMGDSVTDVPSCPVNCFERCVSRPLIISWRSSPMADWGTDVVSLPEGGTVQFYYGLEDLDELGPWTATVDFGDGQTDTATGKEGSLSHYYSCDSSYCEYVAQVSVTNAQSAVSAPTQLSKLIVAVGTVVQDEVMMPNSTPPVGNWP